MYTPPFPGAFFYLLAAPDGTVYAYYKGVNAGRNLYSSADGGEMWGDLGRVGLDWPMGIEQLVVGPDGRLHAGGGDGVPGNSPDPGEAAGGVFRTVEPVVVAVGDGPVPPGTEPAAMAVRVYPNPASGRVTLGWEGAALGEAIHLTIFDALGREVWAARRLAAQHEASVAFDASDLAPGAYVVRAAAGAEVATARFVVAD